MLDLHVVRGRLILFGGIGMYVQQAIDVQPCSSDTGTSTAHSLFDVQKIEAAGFAGMGASEKGAVQAEVGAEAAAKALRRRDDGVDYKENWQLLRRMMADENFREAVLKLM